MLCPTCSHPIYYKGGENTKDHGCQYMQCLARVEACYYGNVSVRPGWYFAEGYTLPFKKNDEWYCIEGWHDRRTVLKKITPFYQRGILDWNHGNPKWGQVLTCSQKEVASIPYMALPVNQGFNREFDVLISHFDNYFKTVTKHKNNILALVLSAGKRMLKKKQIRHCAGCSKILNDTKDETFCLACNEIIDFLYYDIW